MQTYTRLKSAQCGCQESESGKPAQNSARSHPANPFHNGNLVSKFTLQILWDLCMLAAFFIDELKQPSFGVVGQ
jgi:hypothetical protein